MIINSIHSNTVLLLFSFHILQFITTLFKKYTNISVIYQKILAFLTYNTF